MTNAPNAISIFREALEIQTHESYMKRVDKKAADLEDGGGNPQ